MRRLLLAPAVALLLLANIPLPPAPERYVTDEAGVIPDARELALDDVLAQHERETSNQILVYVARRVPAGTTLEDMGSEAIRRWRIGQARKDNCAILFLFIDDRQSRIEVGYGLEGVLTDALSKRILVDLRPSLQASDYAGAAELGARAIIATIAPRQPYDQAAAIEARAADIRARDEELMVPISIFSVLFLAFIAYIFYRVVFVGDWKMGRGRGFGSGSSSSSSSSSSGFSGGGGSGGGGGASDRW